MRQQNLLNNSQQLEFLDILNVMSFCLGVMNLNQNMTQNDKQELEQELNTKITQLLDEIHGHLATQDEKIAKIMEALNIDH